MFVDDNVEVKYIDKMSCIKGLIFFNLVEWIYLFKVVINIFWCWYVLCCVGVGFIVGGKVNMINLFNICIGWDCLILDQVYMCVGLDGYIYVGCDCVINSYVKIFGYGGVVIGNNVQVGLGVLIMIISYDICKVMKVEFKIVMIGDWVWVGVNVIVLFGIIIGCFVVVGVGFIVIKDVFDFVIVVGNLGKIIGENEVVKV